MKRIIKVIFILLICFSIKNVYAENYKLKELIPYKVDTTIHTDNFSYIGMYFDDEGIHFNGVKNLTDGELPISISVGLFNKNGVNVGTINHCDLSLQGKQEMSYFIAFEDKYFGKKYSVKDVKYMAVLSDNMNCRTEGSKDYVGDNIDKLGIVYNTTAENNGKSNYIRNSGSQTELFLSILTILAGAFLVVVIYKLIFTKAYRNINGNEVRKAYDDINKELKEMREELDSIEEKVEEEKTSKPEEIIKQEEEAKTEDKEGTDLHNLYK